MDKLFTDGVRCSLETRWHERVIESVMTQTFLTGCDLASSIGSLLIFWRELGIPRGSKIALCLPSGLKWAELFFAISYSEYTIVALPSDFESAVVAAQHSDCNILYIQSSNYNLINIGDFKCLEYIISSEDNNILWSSSPTQHKYQQMQLTSINELPSNCNHPNDLALIIYTSGTATRIKGVKLSYRNITSCLYANIDRFQYVKDKSYLSLLPFNHIFGLMYDLILPLCSGMNLFVLDCPPIPEFIIPALRAIRPIMLFSVPAVLYKLMEEVKITNDWALLSSCKMIICGGASVKPSFSKWMIEERGLPFAIGYGMSECSPAICVPDMKEYEINSCGKPVDCIQFRIDSDDPEHIPGEVLVKGDSVFMGYYKDETLTSHHFTYDGWFKTGDLAFQSETGNVFLCGRKDSQLSSSVGKNIFLDDLEEILRSNRGIKDALLINQNGLLKAYVVPLGSAYISSIKSYIKELNSHSFHDCFITEVKFVEKLERTEKGTVKRYLYQ